MQWLENSYRYKRKRAENNHTFDGKITCGMKVNIIV